MYITPVLTGLEYVSFRALGVGLRQARLVPELLGVVSVLLIGLGVARIANRRAGAFAAALLATNFVYTMYDRAATIEATMVALLVVAWYGYARAGDSPRWGLLAGFAAILAYFTKASAAFFVAALAIDAFLSLVSPGQEGGPRSTAAGRRRAAIYVCVGLAAAGLIALALFVVPHWQEYRFYNWQISVTRKPSYTLRAFADRASQLPLAADFFSRMWLVLVVGLTAAVARLAAWRKLVPPERLLLLWVGFGIAELVAHDVQERRLLFLVPPLVALAAIVLGRDRRLVPPAVGLLRRPRALLAAPLVLYVFYMACAALAHVPFLAQAPAGQHPAPIVRGASTVALILGMLLYATWRRASHWLARQEWTVTMSLLVVALALAGDLAQFAQWAAGRSYNNYEAMLLVGRSLPPGTLVHGKLANGLALESAIRPVFVGRGFGNYDDRARRDDIRYVLTYVSPFLGYEGGRDSSGRPIILGVLDAYPRWRILRTFPVSESDGGHDAAALIDKMPGRTQAPVPFDPRTAPRANRCP
jgi:4-amino-4-deoxy-L-arabinose transferase-like glycosyltransferase